MRVPLFLIFSLVTGAMLVATVSAIPFISRGSHKPISSSNTSDDPDLEILFPKKFVRLSLPVKLIKAIDPKSMDIIKGLTREQYDEAHKKAMQQISLKGFEAYKLHEPDGHGVTDADWAIWDNLRGLEFMPSGKALGLYK
ncbi:hypothetical protein BC835DRAFT_1310647 [Cytidiella melzeri]|nr:hypothetical protein BC835DRAFT_1310647 [Cytidiella melzeri]